MANTKTNTLKLVELAILTALVILLQSIGQIIPALGTAGNFVLVPIALGAIMLGEKAGAWLGFVCGAVVLIFGAIGKDAFTHILFEMHPIITALICIVKTTVAGFLAGLVYKLLSRKNELIAVFVAAAVVPVTNTGLFICGCFLILDAIKAAQTAFGDSSNVISFIIYGLALANFAFEFIVSVLLAPVISRIIKIVRKNY